MTQTFLSTFYDVNDNGIGLFGLKYKIRCGQGNLIHKDLE